MKINFKYKSTKYVIRKEDFLEQIEAYYGKKYFFRKVDMGEYVADVVVSNNKIKDLKFVGEDLIYYSAIMKNGFTINFSRDEVNTSNDFLQAKIIENGLVVLEMPHYNYLSIVSGYSTYIQEKSINVDPEEHADVLINKLQKIWKKPIKEIVCLINSNMSERVYNGDIEYSVGSQRYKTTDRLVYKSGKYKFAYIPDRQIAIIM